MPTLLSINNYYYYRGGAETVFLEHNKMFEKLAWRVVPFAMQHPKNLHTDWSRHFVKEIEFGEEYSLTQKIVRVPKVIYSLEAKRRLSQLLAEINPDVCHAHNIYHHISPSILGVLKSRGIPTVLTLHDLKVACPAYNMLTHDGVCERCRGGRLYNVLLNRCIKGSTTLSAVVMLESIVHRLLGSYQNCINKFIVPSKFYISKLTEWGMPKQLFKHVPNFVDTAHVRPQYVPGRGVLYFGRVSREKGLATLIKAAAQTGSKVMIAGTGPQMAELQQLVAKLKANVSFLGYLTGETLREAVRAARAVVLPSEWYENAPMTILEAYALGKPIIGARIGGIPELIKENETGLTFASGDEKSLAHALSRITNMSDTEVEKMGECGRTWVETEFTADLYRNRILETYREVGAGTAVRSQNFVTN